MGHLVQKGFRASHPQRLGDARPEHVELGEGHAARVLHRPGGELRHEELVVFAENIGIAEALFEVVEPLPRQLEELIRVEISHQRLPAVDAQGNAAVLLVDRVVVAGHDRSQVGRHRLGLRKAPSTAIALTWRVRYDHPIRRRFHLECVGRFHVGLVEACEGAVRVVAGELAVQINASVERVLKPVKAGAIMHIAGGAQERQRVFGAQVLELQAPSVESAGMKLLAVEHGSRDRWSDELDKRCRARRATSKGHCRVGAKIVVAGREIQADVVVDVGDERSAFLRLSARQVIAKDDACLLAAVGAQQQGC